MKTIRNILAAMVACACSKALCWSGLFLFEEGETALSTVALLLSAAAVLLAALRLDDAIGSPVHRAVSRMLRRGATAQVHGMEVR